MIAAEKRHEKLCDRLIEKAGPSFQGKLEKQLKKKKRSSSKKRGERNKSKKKLNGRGKRDGKRSRKGTGEEISRGVTTDQVARSSKNTTPHKAPENEDNIPRPMRPSPEYQPEPPVNPATYQASFHEWVDKFVNLTTFIKVLEYKQQMYYIAE
jgi:hypothetical protein